MDNPKLILVVEDNENDEMLAIRGLKRSNTPCLVDVARDGIEAIDYLLDISKPLPSLVLLDLKLPKMNGMEVLQSLRANERTRRTPVVVFTSSNQEADVLGCFDCGANSFVRKFIDFDEYTARLAKLAEYWLAINEPCISP